MGWSETLWAGVKLRLCGLESDCADWIQIVRAGVRLYRLESDCTCWCQTVWLESNCVGWNQTLRTGVRLCGLESDCMGWTQIVWAGVRLYGLESVILIVRAGLRLHGHERTFVFCLFLLSVAQQPIHRKTVSQGQICSDNAVTLKKKLQLKLAVAPSQRMLTLV